MVQRADARWPLFPVASQPAQFHRDSTKPDEFVPFDDWRHRWGDVSDGTRIEPCWWTAAGFFHPGKPAYSVIAICQKLINSIADDNFCGRRVRVAANTDCSDTHLLYFRTSPITRKGHQQVRVETRLLSCLVLKVPTDRNTAHTTKSSKDDATETKTARLRARVHEQHVRTIATGDLPRLPQRRSMIRGNYASRFLDPPKVDAMPAPTRRSLDCIDTLPVQENSGTEALLITEGGPRDKGWVSRKRIAGYNTV
ncbi:hypothetical protein LZ30DRAFT_75180 [Colletotrichum cereale]|nr:hypothetical protein LZ30DRAFT_75180 [Colletotrichum cereale]